jgi:hypothetical protein
MRTAGSQQMQPVPGPVEVRVSGDLPAIAAFIDALAAAGCEVPEPGPRGFRVYPNRREPGFRVYLAVRPAEDQSETWCGAAHSHQAIRRPAATHSSRRQLP